MDRVDAEAYVDSIPTHADLAGRPRSGGASKEVREG
jgi:hypothetical protein